jgi:hypothetical protein
MKWPGRHPSDASQTAAPTENPVLGPLQLGMLAIGVVAAVTLAAMAILPLLSGRQSLVTTSYRFDPINEE